MCGQYSRNKPSTRFMISTFPTPVGRFPGRRAAVTRAPKKTSNTSKGRLPWWPGLLETRDEQQNHCAGNPVNITAAQGVFHTGNSGATGQ